MTPPDASRRPVRKPVQLGDEDGLSSVVNRRTVLKAPTAGIGAGAAILGLSDTASAQPEGALTLRGSDLNYGQASPDYWGEDGTASPWWNQGYYDETGTAVPATGFVENSLWAPGERDAFLQIGGTFVAPETTQTRIEISGGLEADAREYFAGSYRREEFHQCPDGSQSYPWWIDLVTSASSTVVFTAAVIDLTRGELVHRSNPLYRNDIEDVTPWTNSCERGEWEASDFYTYPESDVVFDESVTVPIERDHLYAVAIMEDTRVTLGEFDQGAYETVVEHKAATDSFGLIEPGDFYVDEISIGDGAIAHPVPPGPSPGGGSSGSGLSIPYWPYSLLLASPLALPVVLWMKHRGWGPFAPAGPPANVSSPPMALEPRTDFISRACRW